MKKLLLIATGAIVGFSANAMQQEAIDAQKAFQSPVSGERVKAAVKKAVAYKEPLNVTSPDGKYEFYPLISMPVVPFYMGGLISQTEGTFAPLPVPANTPVTYQGETLVGRTAQSVPSFTDWDKFSYRWTYYNPETWLENDILSSEGKDLALTYTPDSYVGTLPIPQMTWRYENQLAAVTAPYKVVIGGQGILPLLGESGGVEPTEIGFTTTVWIDGINKTRGDETCAEAMFGTQRYSNTKQTFTEGTADWGMERYAETFEEEFEQPLKEVKLKGIGYNLPYAGSPYLLKSATLHAWSILLNDVPMTVNFYEADEDGYPVGDPIYTSNTIVPKTRNEEGFMYVSDVKTNFVSEDEDGFELDYIVVDKPLVAIVTGFIDNNDITQFCPMSYGYDWDLNDNVRTIPFTAFTVMDLIGEDGAEVNNHQNYFNLWRFGSDDGSGSVTYYSHRSFDVEIEAEYPYLQATSLFTIKDDDSAEESPIAYEADGNYTINIPDTGEELAVVLATSATSPDEIVFDDEELPEWLQMEVLDGIQYVSPNGAMMNFVEVHFFFDGDFENKSFTVPFMYKNLIANIILKNGDSGVENIVAPNDGKTVYYDLQGRKLNNAPEKGIYILKEGNKVSKVIR